MYAKVIVDITHTKVDKIFDYKLNNNYKIALGHRVLVPFGISNKKIEGFVIGFSNNTDYDDNKIKCIEETLEDYPVLTKNQIDLAFYMKDKLNCTLADCFRLMIPQRLHGQREKYVRYVTLISNDDSSFYTLNGKVKAQKQKDVFDLLKKYKEMTTSQIEKNISGSNSAITALHKKGIIKLFTKEELRTPYENSNCIDQSIVLNYEQKNAIHNIELYNGKKYLIHGITGSGKTEIYMNLISKCLKNKKGCIVLVPEIALTPQAISRFRSRFGNNVALLHSKLSSGERFDQWKLILQGKCNIVLGPRSAIFAPVSNLGLIIVDEEHEDAYVSETFPRYDAKDLGEFRTKENGCFVIASATPSINSYYKAQKGEYKLLEITKRANNKPLPKTFVVDMAQELSNGNKSIIGNLLYEKIKQRLDNKEQIILLLNKRGYASFVMCRGCGHVIKCPHCDVSLAYHKNRQSKVRCHYCGFEKELTKICPICNKPYLKYFGVGTQRVEDEIIKLFPNSKPIRMDFDTTRTKDAYLNIFNSFINNEYNILIGTQMIAKGLDFPNVTLSAIICADNIINLPDYKSNERAFSLITQASGRAGREKKSGEVVIQTYIKDNPIIKFAVKQDYKDFYNYEIGLRKKTMYPPFSKFIRIICQSKSNDLAFENIKKVNKILSKYFLNQDKLLYSCSPCPINYINDFYRYQVLIKVVNDDKCDKMMLDLSNIVNNIEISKNVYIDFEINPKSMI